MPIAGRPPKPEGQRRNHQPLAHEWTDYPDRPFLGAPPLPPRGHGNWSRATLAWWTALSRMPHCVDWTETDWQYAFDAAQLHASFHRWGETKYEAALRAREKVMGTTANYRANLRIRYVSVDTPQGEDEGRDDADGSGRVLSLDDYRRIMADQPSS